jgi:hypothetical protein
MVDLSNIMFGDGRFERKDLRKYFGEIDGKKIGVVLAKTLAIPTALSTGSN